MNERIAGMLNLCMAAKDKGHDAFFNYAGHTQGIEISVFINGWTKKPEGEKNPPDYQIRFYMDDDAEQVEQKIKEVEDFFSQL